MGLSRLHILSLVVGLTTISGFSVGFQKHHDFDASTKNECCRLQRNDGTCNRVIIDKRGSRHIRLYADTSEGSLTTVQGADDGDDDDDMMPSDPATTTTQFLAGLWTLIAQGNSMVRGVSNTPQYSYDLRHHSCAHSLPFSATGIQNSSVSEFGRQAVIATISQFSDGTFGLVQRCL